MDRIKQISNNVTPTGLAFNTTDYKSYKNITPTGLAFNLA